MSVADYGTISIQYNKGASDAAEDWAGTAVAFGGSGNGVNEFRWSDTGCGAAANTGYAAWPYVPRVAAGVQAFRELYMFYGDTTGYKINYVGDRSLSKMFRLSFTADGSFAAAPRWSAFASSAHATPSPGTQTDSLTDGANFINGHATDTSSRSYLKGNGYGCGYPAAGAQETPSNGACGTTLAATSHSADGAAIPGAGSWLATWQDLQGWLSYIQFTATPKVTTAFYYYFTLCLYMGVNLKPGNVTLAPMTLDYSYI